MSNSIMVDAELSVAALKSPPRSLPVMKCLCWAKFDVMAQFCKYSRYIGGMLDSTTWKANRTHFQHSMLIKPTKSLMPVFRQTFKTSRRWAPSYPSNTKRWMVHVGGRSPQWKICLTSIFVHSALGLPQTEVSCVQLTELCITNVLGVYIYAERAQTETSGEILRVYCTGLLLQ